MATLRLTLRPYTFTNPRHPTRAIMYRAGIHGRQSVLHSLYRELDSSAKKIYKCQGKFSFCGLSKSIKDQDNTLGGFVLFFMCAFFNELLTMLIFSPLNVFCSQKGTLLVLPVHCFARPFFLDFLLNENLVPKEILKILRRK